jgi:GNAT superfamily N-acetyltransferase
MTALADYRMLTLADVEHAADIIAQAFINDPMVAFILPVKSARYHTLRKFFRIYGEMNILNRRGYGTGEPLKGVAYWQAPGQESLSISIKAVGRLLPLIFTAYPFGFFRARPIFRATDRMHQQYAPGAHYYLDNLGVLPSAQGAGLSSKLIRPILEQADAQGVIAYTDTTSRANVGFYAHFGFECMEEAAIPGTGITVFALRRNLQ